ncbi:MAG: hypothetical protein RLZZ107_117 [Bacteroidota bacterium]
MGVVENRREDRAFDGKRLVYLKKLVPLDAQCPFVEVFFTLDVEFVYLNKNGDGAAAVEIEFVDVGPGSFDLNSSVE